jgi:hypothetical protein
MLRKAKAARSKNERPLQNQRQTSRPGFVEAVPSHDFRDRTRTLHYESIHKPHKSAPLHNYGFTGRDFLYRGILMLHAVCGEGKFRPGLPAASFRNEDIAGLRNQAAVVGVLGYDPPY